MHTTKIPALLMILLWASFSSAQSTPPKPLEPPFIEVTGSAEKEVVPDEIYIRILLKEKYENKVKITLEEQEAQLKQLVSNIGIPLANLQVADANADYVKVRWQKKDVLSKIEYSLKVPNATTLGKVFMELETVEVSDAFIYKVGHSRMDSLTKVVKIEAIKSAKDKAQYLLTAIGEQLGQPLVIHETIDLPNGMASGVSIRGSRSVPTQYYIDGIRVKGGGDNNEIQFQKIKIGADIYIKFAIRE